MIISLLLVKLFINYSLFIKYVLNVLSVYYYFIVLEENLVWPAMLWSALPVTCNTMGSSYHHPKSGIAAIYGSRY